MNECRAHIIWMLPTPSASSLYYSIPAALVFSFLSSAKCLLSSGALPSLSPLPKMLFLDSSFGQWLLLILKPQWKYNFLKEASPRRLSPHRNKAIPIFCLFYYLTKHITICNYMFIFVLIWLVSLSSLQYTFQEGRDHSWATWAATSKLDHPVGIHRWLVNVTVKSSVAV